MTTRRVFIGKMDKDITAKLQKKKNEKIKLAVFGIQRKIKV